MVILYPAALATLWIGLSLPALAQEANGAPEGPPAELNGANLEKIATLVGSIKESGVVSGAPVVSELLYLGPENFAVRYVAPAAVAGARIFYDHTAFRIFFPAEKSGTVIRNFPRVPSLIKNTVLHLHGSYEPSESKVNWKTPSSRKFVNLKSTLENPVVSEVLWEIDSQFSFPAKFELRFPHGPPYTREYARLEYNPKLRPTLPRPFMPLEIDAFEWDFRARNVPQKEFADELRMWFQIPPTLGPLKLEKVVRNKGKQVAYGAFYTKPGGSFVVMAFFRRELPSGFPAGMGITVEARGGHRGQLIPGPLLNVFTFTNEDTRYVLTGNVPVEELLLGPQGIKLVSDEKHKARTAAQEGRQ